MGSQGVGGSWAGTTLPINLQTLGAPGCAWAVSADVVFPVTASLSGNAQTPLIMLPSSPQLENQILYDQAAFLDPAANALGIVTGVSTRWQIGALRPGSRVSAVGPAAHLATTGLVEHGHAITMRLQ